MTSNISTRSFSTVPIGLLTTLLLCFSVAGCSGSNVKTSHDISTTADIASYQTYAFIDEHPMAVSQNAEGPVSPMLEGRLMESVRIALNAKGYEEVRSLNSADFAVSFTVGSREQIKVDSYPVSYHAGWANRYDYYGGYGGMSMGTETRVRQYTEGQLAVDLWDVSSRTPAFHGVAVTKITDQDREDQQAFLDNVTAEALSAFPLVGGITPSEE